MLLKNNEEIKILENLLKCTKDSFGNPLVCSGCAHSAINSVFPGIPSGERSCFFCIRNSNRDKWQEEFMGKFKTKLESWIDGSKPVKIPMDCYHSIDFLDQVNIWNKKGNKKGNKNG